MLFDKHPVTGHSIPEELRYPYHVYNHSFHTNDIRRGVPGIEGRSSECTYRLTCDRIHHVMLVPVPPGARGGPAPPRLRKMAESENALSQAVK